MIAHSELADVIDAAGHTRYVLGHRPRSRNGGDEVLLRRDTRQRRDQRSSPTVIRHAMLRQRLVHGVVTLTAFALAASLSPPVRVESRRQTPGPLRPTRSRLLFLRRSRPLMALGPLCRWATSTSRSTRSGSSSSGLRAPTPGQITWRPPPQLRTGARTRHRRRAIAAGRRAGRPTCRLLASHRHGRRRTLLVERAAVRAPRGGPRRLGGQLQGKRTRPCWQPQR